MGASARRCASVPRCTRSARGGASRPDPRDDDALRLSLPPGGGPANIQASTARSAPHKEARPMLYRKSPARPTRLLLAIAAGAGAGVAFPLASCGGATDNNGILNAPEGQSGSESTGSASGAGSGTATSGATGSGATSGSPGGGTSGAPPPPPPASGTSSGAGSGSNPCLGLAGLCIFPDASVVTGVVPLPADGGSDVRLGLIIHPEGGEDVLLGTIVHPEGGADVLLGTIIHPDGGPFGVIIRPPDAGDG